MSMFIPDAAILGFSEAIKLGLVWFIMKTYFRGVKRTRLLRPFYLGLAIVTVVIAVSLMLFPSLEARELFENLKKYVFFLFFTGSILVLYLERSGFQWPVLSGTAFAWVAIVLATVFYFSPDTISSSMYVRALAMMKENALGVYITGAVVFIVVLSIIYFALRRRGAVLSSYFALGQVLLTLSLIKLLGGWPGSGAGGSLIPSVQRGAMKFIHDFVHQTFVYLMVPDHPLFQLEAWQYIGILFGSNFGLAATLVIMLLPPLWYLYDSFATPLPEPAADVSSSERRRSRALIRKTIRMKAVPVAAFVIMVFASWYTWVGTDPTELYVPQPKPVVEDKGIILVPLTDPTMDLMDGNLHKFSVTRGTDTVNFLVIKRPDGTLAVALDACEICPPEGYGQGEGQVVCLYCRTPIPIDSIGKAGGCNPIPLDAQVGDKFIRIDVKELDRKWQQVVSGAAKEGIR